MKLFDSHTHFDDHSFDADRDAAFARARAAGVEAQVLAGVSAAEWPQLRDTCRRYPGLYPAYGLHPLYLAEHCDAHLEQLRTWIDTEQPVAVGECGLDFSVEDLARTQQWHFFSAQLEIARETGLPVVLHARRCVEEVILHLRRYPGLRGMVHSFAGSLEQARRLGGMGFYLSFGGPLTYPRAQRLQRIIKALPLEWLLLETDAPDQPLAAHRGERNEPARLPEVLHVVAEIRGEDPAYIAEIVWKNAVTLYFRVH